MSTLGRLVLLIWLFVVLVINSSYTASPTSILTVEHLSSPIKGTESLVTDDEPIGYQVGSFSERYLSEELNITRSRLVPFGSPEEYALALEHDHGNGGVAAVVDERPYVELLLSRQCKFRIIGQELTKSGWGFILQQLPPAPESASRTGAVSSCSRRLQRISSLLDEKDEPKSGRKRSRQRLG